MVNSSNSIPHKWDYEAREVTVYSLENGQLSRDDNFTDANAKYGLQSGQTFLGHIDDVVFYWTNYNPSIVFWRRVGEAGRRTIKLPRQVIDVFGVTRGIHKHYGLVVFRKSSGFHTYAPYEHTFWEFDLKATEDSGR